MIFFRKVNQRLVLSGESKGIPLDSNEQEELLTIYLAKTKSKRTVVGKKSRHFLSVYLVNNRIIIKK